MADARTERAARGLLESWRRLNFEQKVAAVGALLLIVSTFGPFSFVEAAEVLTALGVLALLRARADGKRFHLPFGDGTVVFAAGCWAALLIVVRLFDRPLGQNLLALACAGILALAGAAERRKRPPDDVPAEERGPERQGEEAAVPREEAAAPGEEPRGEEPAGEAAAGEEPAGEAAPGDAAPEEAPTRRLPDRS